MKKNLVIGSLIVTSLVQFASPALANKETIGNIIGGLIGGAIGSNIGKGNGNKAAIIVGAIAGTMIGGKVGKDMDANDQRALLDAQNRGLRGSIGTPCAWDGRGYGSRTGARGTFTAMSEGYNPTTGEYCREYISEVTTYSGTERTHSVACSRADGSWYDMRSVIRLNGMGSRHEPSRPPRYPEVPSRPSLPPPPPSYGGYEGSVQISQITRRPGGEWYRVTLLKPVALERIEVRALSMGLKIHDMVLHTNFGAQIRVNELSPTASFYAGETAVSEALNGGRGELVQAIDLRAESMGGNADILVRVISNMDYPSLTVTRY